MKTARKALILTLCAVLITAASVMGTLAYLTATDEVTNTFTVGKVDITLDETKVDTAGSPVPSAAPVQQNAYHLLPGHTYTKDPTVHVDADSEDCYVFVKVENGIAAFESAEQGYTPISQQILANGWTALDGVTGVYYQTYAKGQTDRDLEVFDNFKISGTADEVNGWSAITAASTKVVVNGYAVQMDGFDTAAAAWSATFGK